jgi:uncharacterized protein YndB with AHSA1/START domain
MWQCEHSIETKAPAERVWALFSDVAGWPRWIAGLDHAEMKGPFEAGSTFVMTPKGQGPVTSRLTEVKKNETFVDESRMGETVIRVVHRIQAIAPGRTRVSYCPEVSGPSAEEIGKAISADFPDVLKALAALAEFV